MNKYCNLDGTKKIKNEYGKINIGFDAVETDINSTNTRVDNIITTPVEGVSAQEIIDARDGKATLGNNVNGIKTDLAAHKADSVSAHGVNLKANKTQEAWIIPTFQNGWQQGYLARYRKNEFGTLELRGTIASGTTTGGTVIFTLPLGYRPSVLQILTVSSYDGGLVSKNTMLLINTNGEVSIYGEASKTSITMNGTVFL